MNRIKEEFKQEIDQILAKYPEEHKRSAVMPLLVMAQSKAGYVSQEDVKEIAEMLEISTTEVNSIIGFYTLFHAEPGGTYRLQICTDVACALRGSEEFLKQVCDFLDVKPGETTKDGLFTVEAVMCLASCHKAPMFQVQHGGSITYHDHQTFETAKQWIEGIRSAHPQDQTEGKEVEA